MDSCFFGGSLASKDTEAESESQKIHSEFWHLLERGRYKIKEGREEITQPNLASTKLSSTKSRFHKTTKFSSQHVHHFTRKGTQRHMKASQGISVSNSFYSGRWVNSDSWGYKTHRHKQLFIARIKHIWPRVIKAGSKWSFLVPFFQSKNRVNYAEHIIIAKNVIMLALRNFLWLSCKFALRLAYPRNLNIRKWEGSNLWSHSLWDWLLIRNFLQVRKQPLG